MGKKCIPGSTFYCIENMTLFVLFFFFLLIGYLYYIFLVKGPKKRIEDSSQYEKRPVLMGVATRTIDSPNRVYDSPNRVYDSPNRVYDSPNRVYDSPNVVLDPYGPPLRNDGYYFPRDSADTRGQIQLPGSQAPIVYEVARPKGVAINVETRGISSDYSQLGILTRSQNRGDDMILPLMGRRLVTGLDKWQYYTISNTGNMNTKLPVSLNGRSCSGEYGCDCINNGDMVFVEGYNDSFRITMYENSRFNYIPFI